MMRNIQEMLRNMQQQEQEAASQIAGGATAKKTEEKKEVELNKQKEGPGSQQMDALITQFSRLASQLQMAKERKDEAAVRKLSQYVGEIFKMLVALGADPEELKKTLALALRSDKGDKPTGGDKEDPYDKINRLAEQKKQQQLQQEQKKKEEQERLLQRIIVQQKQNQSQQEQQQIQNNTGTNQPISIIVDSPPLETVQQQAGAYPASLVNYNLAGSPWNDVTNITLAVHNMASQNDTSGLLNEMGPSTVGAMTALPFSGSASYSGDMFGYFTDSKDAVAGNIGMTVSFDGGLASGTGNFSLSTVDSGTLVASGTINGAFDTGSGGLQYIPTSVPEADSGMIGRFYGTNGSTPQGIGGTWTITGVENPGSGYEEPMAGGFRAKVNP